MNYLHPCFLNTLFVRLLRASGYSKLRVAIGLVIFSAKGINAQVPASQADFFAPATKVVAVFTGGVGHVCEGPAMAPDGRVFFTDVPSATNAGAIWAYTPQTGKTSLLRSPSGNASGLLFDADGNLITVEGANSGGRQLTKTDLKTGICTVLANAFRGKPFNAPNDATIDRQGRIYFTDARYAGSEPIDQPFMGIYGLDPNGTVQLLAANATKPNGIAVSPDQQTLFVSSYETPNAGVYGNLPTGFNGPVAGVRGDLYAYDLLPNGQVKLRKLLAHFEGEGPDGVKVDVEGNVYTIIANKVVVYSPQGEKLAELPVPIAAGSATNLCFGRGKYSKTLFITATKTLYQVDIRKEGWQLPFNH